MSENKPLIINMIGEENEEQTYERNNKNGEPWYHKIHWTRKINHRVKSRGKPSRRNANETISSAVRDRGRRGFIKMVCTNSFFYLSYLRGQRGSIGANANLFAASFAKWGTVFRRFKTGDFAVPPTPWQLILVINFSSYSTILRSFRYRTSWCIL